MLYEFAKEMHFDEKALGKKSKEIDAISDYLVHMLSWPGLSKRGPSHSQKNQKHYGFHLNLLIIVRG